MTVPPSYRTAACTASTFYVLHPHLHVYLETVVVLLSHPHVVAVSEAAVSAAAVSEAELVVFAALFSVSLLSVALVFVFVVAVSPSQIPVDISVEPGVAVFAAVEPVIFVVSEPVVFVAVVSADVAEHQVFVDIVLAFAVLIPVSVVVAWVDNPGRPTFFSFPSIDYSASPSSSVEVVDEESAHIAIGARSNHGPCNALSNLVLRHNKSLEHDYNSPNHGYNSVSDTNDLATDATTSHSRKTGLPLYREQRRHYWFRVILPRPAVLRIR
jgi:hypothetical protein